MPKRPTTEQTEAYLALFEGDREAAHTAIRELSEESFSPTHFVSPSIPTNHADTIIAVASVTKSYKVGRQKINALNTISLDIYKGEFVAITGASGSGKSTLLQLIGGLDKPSVGTITVNNALIDKMSDRQLSKFRNQTIGFVFQFFYLQPFLTLKRNIEIAGMPSRMKRSDRRRHIAALAESTRLSERLNHFPRELSGGQMQRAAIARALLNSPSIILADEPTGNLDSDNSHAIIELFDSVRRQFGTTIVIVTHDQQIAARADRIITLKDGAIV